MKIYLVVFDKASFAISEKLFSDIEQFIDNNYIDEKALYSRRRDIFDEMSVCLSKENICETKMSVSMLNLDDIEKRLEEKFSERLLRLIDESGKTDVEVYKKANVDRKLFSIQQKIIL